MRKLSWPAWIWLQLIIPLASGVIGISICFIPFAFKWLPMTTVNGLLAFLLGIAYFVYCLFAQKRAIARGGMVPPFY